MTRAVTRVMGKGVVGHTQLSNFLMAASIAGVGLSTAFSVLIACSTRSRSALFNGCDRSFRANGTECPINFTPWLRLN